ncbi:MAG: hypothetical protein C0404_13195 [Verrucomicrobia bacterium]|nr:hypothetical protein [Verrucomicrobiota bacterium]
MHLPTEQDSQTTGHAGLLLGALGLVMLAIVAFSPAIRGEFIWDDDTHVTRNVLTYPDGLYRSWFTTDQPNYWPVTWTAFWIQWKLWGLDPFGYHVVTIFLHGACGVMLWRVLRMLGIPGAWFAAAIFTVHPVNAQTAAWITQQKNILSVLFALVSLLLVFSTREKSSRPAYALALSAFLVSLLAKTVTIMLPFVILGCIWWREKRLTAKDLLWTAPFFLLSLLLGLNEIWFQEFNTQALTVRHDSLLERTLMAGYAHFFYIARTLLPVDLCFVYAKPAVSVQTVSAYLPFAAGAILAGVGLWKIRTWGRGLLFGLGFYSIAILPVLGFMNIYFMRYSPLADHWQYFAMIGTVALAGASLAVASSGLPRPAAAGLAVLVLAALCWLSFERSGVFASNELLWQDTLAKNPRSTLANNNYGLLLLGRGDVAGARRHLEPAASDGNPESRLSLASVLKMQGDTRGALRLVETVLQSVPDNPDAIYELGRLRLESGDPGRAGECFRRLLVVKGAAAKGLLGLAAIAELGGRREEIPGLLEKAVGVDPRNENAWHELGRANLGLGRLDAAAESFRKAIALNPRFASPYVGLALVADRQNDAGEVLRLVGKVAEINPAGPDVNFACGELMLARGKPAAAAGFYAKTAAVNPLYPDVYNNLGIACGSLGQVDKAISYFSEALRLNPEDGKARKNLETAQGQRKP